MCIHSLTGKACAIQPSRQTCCEDDSWLYQAPSTLATAGVTLYEKLSHC